MLYSGTALYVKWHSFPIIAHPNKNKGAIQMKTAMLLGLILFVLLFITFWLLHKRVIISVQFIYQPTKKFVSIRLRWFFIQVEKKIDFTEEEDPFSLVDYLLNKRTQENGPMREYLSEFKKMAASLRLDQFQWKSIIGLKQADETAILYGIGHAVKHTLFRLLNTYIKKANQPDIAVQPDYQTPQFQSDFLCIFSAPIGHIIGSLYRLKKMNNEVRNE